MITVNVPDTQFEGHRAGPLIVRTAEPRALMSVLRNQETARIACIQILDLCADLQPLLGSDYAGPLDVVVPDPDTAIPHLYRLAELAQAYPVRVSVVVTPGFLKVVRLAASLHCAVRLQVGQPNPPLVAELQDAVEFYVHGSGVTEPIEFFHSLLMAYFDGAQVSLWDVQEENPAIFRQMTDDGREVPPARLAHLPLNDVVTPNGECNTAYLSAHPECSECLFHRLCGGYFKWPDKTYSCHGVKGLLERIRSAAKTLKEDIQAHARAIKVDYCE